MIEDEKNWYQNPYVWLILFFPLSAIVGCMFTIRLAIISDDGLVTDDYYKKGLEINRVLRRDKFSEQAGLIATINLDHQLNKVKLMLTANQVLVNETSTSSSKEFEFPSEIKVTFMNKTRKGFDRNLRATHLNNGIYEAELPSLIRGNWYVQIETDEWRLVNSLTTN